MRNSASFIRIIGFAVFGYLFLNWIGTTGETSIFKQTPWVWVAYAAVVLFHIAAEISIGALQGVLYKTLNPEAKKKYDEEIASAEANQFKWIKETYKKSLGTKPLEEEHEIILDHNYDGIQELDNNLPPWWVYGFYATIVFALVYMVRYHVFNGTDQAEEYTIEVAEAKIAVEQYKKTAKNLVDINTVTLLTEASDLKIGKTIFMEKCIACHKADGGGGIGPNLTDAHWILGGGIKNVFKTISEGGRPSKGMIPWKTELKPAEMAQVASYVLSLQGTTPAEPKEPQGDIWVDPEAKIK